MEKIRVELLKKEAIESLKDKSSTGSINVELGGDNSDKPLFINVLETDRKWRTPEDHINKALDYIMDRNTWELKDDVTLGDLTLAEDQLRRAEMRSNNEIYSADIAKLRNAINKKKMTLS